MGFSVNPAWQRQTDRMVSQVVPALEPASSCSEAEGGGATDRLTSDGGESCHAVSVGVRLVELEGAALV